MSLPVCAGGYTTEPAAAAARTDERAVAPENLFAEADHMHSNLRDIGPDITDTPAAAAASSSLAPQGGNARNTVPATGGAERPAAACPGGTSRPPTVGRTALPKQPRGTLQRGLSGQLSTNQLQVRSWTIALSLANRFRVIRTLDVAVACYPERPFKTALGAAQRAVRGMVKADLLRRYKTARFQTTYGLTARGAAWLAERGIEAQASVRRVSDMTNPEHLLWAQCLVLCAEQRGLHALTERELLAKLNEGALPGSPMRGGLFAAMATVRGKARRISLRPDAVVLEAEELTAIEVDCSARGSQRAASLCAEVLSIGRSTTVGAVLRRVVVYCRTPRIRNRVSATLAALKRDQDALSLDDGRCRLKASEQPDEYEVWKAKEMPMGPTHKALREVLVGRVIVQDLPVWLPKYRADGRQQHADLGWLDDNYLPWRRPACDGAWAVASSPLLLSASSVESTQLASATRRP